MALRPGTNELWIGDVGWDDWEEIDRLGHVRDSAVENFGWPCYEGTGRQPGYDGRGPRRICEGSTRAPGAVTDPVFTYRHGEQVVPGEACGTGSSSVTGPRVLRRTERYPTRYDGALFFADYSAQLHLDDAVGTERRARPVDARHLRGGAPRHRSISRSAPAATSSTSTSTAAPSAASAIRRPTPRRRPPSTTPDAGLRWRVGEPIAFAGSPFDAEEGRAAADGPHVDAPRPRTAPTPARSRRPRPRPASQRVVPRRPIPATIPPISSSS